MNYNSCKLLVDDIIDDYIKNIAFDERFKNGINYILQGGKRLRPILTLAIIEQLNSDRISTFKQICLVSEFIHSASLIIDDLPIFDNASIRRDKQCVHLVYGEGISYLLPFTLVTEAILLVNKQFQQLKKLYSIEDYSSKYEEQITNIITNISTRKSIEGQLKSTFHINGNVNLRDIALTEARTEQSVMPKDNKALTDKGLECPLDPFIAHHGLPQICEGLALRARDEIARDGTSFINKLTHDEIYDIIIQKTSSFFEISIVLGWIVGGGDINSLDIVKELAKLLGLCYQIYDDFIDYDEDCKQYSHNYVYHCGYNVAYKNFISYQEEIKVIIKELKIECPVFDYILNYMNDNVSKCLKFASLYN